MASAATDTVSLLAAQLTSLNTTLVSIEAKINESNAVAADMWRLGSAIFIFLMQLGFSLLEAGTVRFKNTRNIMLKNVLDTCVCAIAFWTFGYAIGFGSGSPFIGWNYPKYSFIPETDLVAFFGDMRGYNGIQFFFQFTFAATATTIIAGAVAERTHLSAYLFYNFFLSALIYPVVAHVIWSRNGLLSADRGIKILGTNGIIDNAGSLVVHVTGGVCSLVGSWMVGPRIGRFDIDGNVVPFKSHSVVYMAAGTLILWVGFYGFNAGSVDLSPGENLSVWCYQVARVAVNTTICAAFAGFSCFLITLQRKDPAPEDTFNAAIGGLVAACATSSVVEPFAAAIIGSVAGGLYLVGTWCITRLRIDDPVMASPVHLFCGTWGALAVGFFATKGGIQTTYQPVAVYTEGIFYGGNGSLLGIQILGLLFVYVWVGSTSFILFYFLDIFGLLRVKRQEEEVGLDVAFHGGENTGQDEDGHQIQPKQFLNRNMRRNLGFLTSPSLFRMFGLGDSKGENKGDFAITKTKEVPFKSLESTPYGYYSFALYEANYIMEDFGQVEASSSGVYIGVHDGHAGTETAEFLKENMFNNLKSQFVRKGGGVSADAIRAGFAETEFDFAELVRKTFDKSPHLATVGACTVSCLITANALWVANVGDCRAVLGQVRRSDEGNLECRALQLSVDHNLSDANQREKYIAEHSDDPEIVVQKRGFYKVKGKLSVTRSIGDMYMKSKEFNRDPLFSRFRIAEPWNPPLLTAEPNVSVRLLSPHDSFVIVASDGLFELLSNQEAVDIVASSPKKDVARKLIRASLHRAAERHEVTYQELLRMPSGERRAHHDDMTVVVFYFDHETRLRANRDEKWEVVDAREGESTREFMERKVKDMGDVDVVGTYHGGKTANVELNGVGSDAV